MSEHALLSPVDEPSPALIQARLWVERKISATEKSFFIDRAQRLRDQPSNHGTSETGLLRTVSRICDLFPWPSNEALRTAAEKRLTKLVGGVEPFDACLAYDLILDLLENPDALLN